MTTLARTTKIVHYAAYMIDGHDVSGTAELVTGTGYLFRADGERAAYLVTYTDPELMLYGLVDMADAQHAIDQGRGGLVHTVSRTTQDVYYPETDDAPDMQRW